VVDSFESGDEQSGSIKMWGICRVADDVSASHKGLWSVELDSQ
jgi:hypothetical protein